MLSYHNAQQGYWYYASSPTKIQIPGHDLLSQTVTRAVPSGQGCPSHNPYGAKRGAYFEYKLTMVSGPLKLGVTTWA